MEIHRSKKHKNDAHIRLLQNGEPVFSFIILHITLHIIILYIRNVHERDKNGLKIE